MKSGHLSQYFCGIAVKRLSAVEAEVCRSNQHEFNGVEGLRSLFGSAVAKQTFPARFIYLNDHANDAVVADGFLTWYDARERHPTRSEHRLYFPSTTVSERAAVGDLLVIARRPDDSVLVVVAESDSTIANQVQWLFGVSDLLQPGYAIREDLGTESDRIAFASRLILEAIGVEVEPVQVPGVDDLLRRFGPGFPSTREFSGYARATLPDVDPFADPDAALIAWMEREEHLFRALERHLISERLEKGFAGDVDAFIAFSLSVQNRRKSRVGYALENHVDSLFAAHGIRFTRTAVTENRASPDFLFPGATEYHDAHFDPIRLTMLGVKSTCKDRWRQVLAEADRIEPKHLLTLEVAISTNQTAEMQTKRVQLVLPRSLHTTFTPAQQGWLMDIRNFCNLVLARQK
jgi:hypothetical protein